MRKLLCKFISLTEKISHPLPLPYSILLVILIPTLLIINTVWNLNAYERDMEYSIRERLLDTYTIVTGLIDNKNLTNTTYQNLVLYVNKSLPNLTSISVIEPNELNQFRVTSTNRTDLTELDQRLVLNSLTWNEDRVYFTQINDPHFNQTSWVLVGPIHNADNQIVALINLKTGTERVQTILSRTSRDALIILAISVVITVLLLLNHAQFYEKSLLYNKLAEINQMKDDFISVASHELRTPLTAIKSYVAMVERDLGDAITEKTQHRLVVIRSSIQRLDNLVEDLLNVSRIEQNRINLELSPTDLGSVVGEVVEQLQPTAADKKLTLTYTPPNPSIIITANANRLREVFTNLVGNAIKYTPAGEVSVTYETTSKTVKVMVKDSGVGISPEDQDRLFTKFTRIRTDQTRDIPGTGLGLWITKELVERMHGKIYLDSIPHQGSVFTVVFPQ